VANWYVSVNGNQSGPYTEADFERMRAQGMVPPQAYVWREGMKDWILASDLPGGASAAPPPPPVSDRSPQFGPSAYPFATDPFASRGQPYAPSPYGVEQAAASPSPLVIAAYVLGGCAVLCSCFTGIPAIICAAIAMGQPGQRKHGMVALFVSIACLVVGMIIGIVLNEILGTQNGF
jgi:hypothetical protein